MVSNIQINSNDPSIMYLNPRVISNKDLFELMRKSAGKEVAGILVYHRDCIRYLNTSDCFPRRLSH